MTWLQRYKVRHFVQNSIWLWPLVSIVAALVAVRLLHWLEETTSWEANFHPSTAQAVLSTMAAAMFTLVVFVSSALLVVVQLSSSQLTPRIIAFVFRDRFSKFALTVFVFTFTFTLSALLRVTTIVPPLSAHFAAYSCLVSLGIFLFLIDHVGKALRPGWALWAVAWVGREVIQTVYPQPFTGLVQPPAQAGDVRKGQLSRTITNPKDGVFLAFDVQGLLASAQRANCVIELVPQVGEFVAIGDPMFRLYQGGESLSASTLCQAVAVGRERTLEQDPAYAFRIMVDIACKGLSPAINDPTTAVLALDQIHHLLRSVGSRRLDAGETLDATGQLRLIYRTPDWEDFVYLAVTEIRQFGGESIQVARRLRAMLENLIQTLPEGRRDALRQQLQLLRRSTERLFAEPEDRAMAEISDFQGVGGNHNGNSTNMPAKKVDFQ